MRFYPLVVLVAVASYAAWRWGIVGLAIALPLEVAILISILRLRGFTWRAALALVLVPWRSPQVCLSWNKCARCGERRVWEPGAER